MITDLNCNISYSHHSARLVVFSFILSFMYSFNDASVNEFVWNIFLASYDTNADEIYIHTDVDVPV